ncbi:hypothetical protein [Meiothermus sp. Pnk-1]|uniref:hypothetical protein n=1 Tax=Meiothermus sp. Pnk-1 TaxID=873128 RepID=UPI000D7CDED4|nr:hypothetical protein [Meiothermus sp. Pnk-1]PZA08281.1 hypothetical protein DNA98_03855 [Meiothermus sp. Pnk-1]
MRELGLNDHHAKTAIRYVRSLMEQEPERLPRFDDDLEGAVRRREDELEQLREKNEALSKAYAKALEQASLVEALARRIEAIAPKSYSPLGAGRVPPRPRGQTPESYVLLLSDAHVGQVVSADQTLGFGRYDLNVFLDRLAFLEQSVASYLEHHTTSPVDRLVVVLLGDIIHGDLDHANEADQVVVLADQWLIAAHAIAQFLRNLASLVPDIEVYGVVGNHPRWANQRKMPTVNRYSNLDWFVYQALRMLTRDVPNILWNLNRQPYAVFEVQGWVFHAGHGDHLKGGDRAMGIPAHAIARQINTQTQLFVRGHLRPPSFYLFGDKHRGMQLPHGLGEVIFNGAFPGVDNYSFMANYSPAEPMQQLIRIHPRYGRTALYSLKLQDAPPGFGRHYRAALEREGVVL